MNSFVVWAPSIAAAGLLGTAAVLAAEPDYKYAEPVATQPVVFSEPEPVAEPDSLDVEEQAAKDDDGGDLLDIMERRLNMARRVSSTMKNSAPTKEGKRKLESFRYKAGLDLKKLRQLGQTVPDATFSRAEEIVAELEKLKNEGADAYRAFRPDRQNQGQLDRQGFQQGRPDRQGFQPNRQGFQQGQQGFQPQRPQQPAYQQQPPQPEPQQDEPADEEFV